jgi:hypothetical protein
LHALWLKVPEKMAASSFKPKIKRKKSSVKTFLRLIQNPKQKKV